MKLKNWDAYELIEERRVEDLASDGYLLRHKKSGARVLLLSNEDHNKVFSIGFRTPPADSTGVPHILEHSVLCGSEKFPVKDPFVELVKGSLNTFLNAMTYPDKTVYPVASCNDKDFKNLMHVYMDAVFYPNIYKHPEIFKQEGWHYELNAPSEELTINGVVYNEMKGAYSSPEDVLDREIYNSLYPDTAYALESGGDPDVIPTLTYEAFLDFHRKYYHPSNCYIYLYGDMDMEERLSFLDREYLSSFEKTEVDSEIRLQKPFDKMRTVKKKYSVTEDETLSENTYLSYSAVIDTSLNRELYLAFQILEYSLLEAPGAPLKQALLDRKIGKDIISSYENGIYQPYFSVIAKNANASDEEAFLSTIREVLEGLVKNGIDKKSLQAGINYYEFKYREADFGSYPKGLMYGLQAYDSWLYDEFSPFMHIEANETFAWMKEKAESGYFEKLIADYLLDNPHSVLVVVEPERGLNAKKEKLLAEKLASYKASLSAEEIERLVADTKALKAYQEEPSSQEDLKKIPLLQISDIEKKAEPFLNQEDTIDGIRYLYHDYFTNGIGYIALLFDLKNVPEELIPYLGILKAVLGLVDTEHYSYGDLFNEINRRTGGISCNVSTYAHARNLGEYVAEFEIRAKTLYEEIPFVFEMMEEILFTSSFDDDKRLYEIIAMLKSRMQMVLTSAGHSTTALRAMSYFSNTSYYADLIGGIHFYRLIEKIEGNFEEEKEGVKEKLKALCTYIFCKDNLLVDYTGSRESFEDLSKEVQRIAKRCASAVLDEVKAELPLVKKNEGFKSSSQVQYVAMAGNFREKGLAYTGALKVLKVIMGYEYLWNNVRVKGGAYGCMNSFTRIGDSYFVSYRDPNLTKTIDIYENVVDYLKNFTAEQRDMTKFVIGAVSDMDTPLNPRAKGIRSLTAYLGQYTDEEAQRERDEVLSTDVETIRSLAPYAEAVLSDHNLCVIGSEEAITEEADLFLTVETLY